ncbi:VOC family protein [Micromonospora okii]|uniref:VOC family protein n=1 Tax=Micromonospora okii TaxID=1182970 RepID=UPI001E3D92BD|nr:VOC family protein [Micromonospora okii]
MAVNLAAIIIDAADLDAESGFWHALLGGSLMKAEHHHFLRADGLPAVVIQRAPDHVPPAWPSSGTQQMHVDLTTDDLDASDRTATTAGARRLQPVDDADLAAHQTNRIYASPAGHPFCLRAT